MAFQLFKTTVHEAVFLVENRSNHINSIIPRVKD
jgi:hypothetical protein